MNMTTSYKKFLKATLKASDARIDSLEKQYVELGNRISRTWDRLEKLRTKRETLESTLSREYDRNAEWAARVGRSRKPRK